MEEPAVKIDTLLNHLREFSRYVEFLGCRKPGVQGFKIVGFWCRSEWFETSGVFSCFDQRVHAYWRLQWQVLHWVSARGAGLTSYRVQIGASVRWASAPGRAGSCCLHTQVLPSNRYKLSVLLCLWEVYTMFCVLLRIGRLCCPQSLFWTQWADAFHLNVLHCHERCEGVLSALDFSFSLSTSMYALYDFKIFKIEESYPSKRV